MTHDELVKEWSASYASSKKTFGDWIAERLTCLEHEMENWRRQCLEEDAAHNRRTESVQRLYLRIEELTKRQESVDSSVLLSTIGQYRDEVFPEGFSQSR